MSNRMIASVVASAFAVALGSTFASAEMVSEANMMKTRVMVKKEVASGKMEKAKTSQRREVHSTAE